MIDIDCVFLDTNILIYAHSRDDEQKFKITEFLLDEKLKDSRIFVSVQIVNEFYSVMSKYKMPHSRIKECVKDLSLYANIKSISFDTVKSAFYIKKKYHYSWWDSLVLASALENDCKIIYSEDMQHGQVIENTLEIVNPFI
ncbi:MAG: PIN domain-containing protein [Fibromonadaceae bacterium]|jgi:predicted nucleic acid-binding protein|nr:PIN domain-containing protein [Fibromonadaceae bacterium]